VSLRSEAQAHVCLAPPGMRYYNTLSTFRLFFIIRVWYHALSLSTMHVFKVQASSASHRLPLCQILFLTRPPLLREYKHNQVMQYLKSLNTPCGILFVHDYMNLSSQNE